jgi:hypothetical protein
VAGLGAELLEIISNIDLLCAVFITEMLAFEFLEIFMFLINRKRTNHSTLRGDTQQIIS